MIFIVTQLPYHIISKYREASLNLLHHKLIKFHCNKINGFLLRFLFKCFLELQWKFVPHEVKGELHRKGIMLNSPLQCASCVVQVVGVKQVNCTHVVPPLGGGNLKPHPLSTVLYSTFAPKRPLTRRFYKAETESPAFTHTHGRTNGLILIAAVATMLGEEECTTFVG